MWGKDGYLVKREPVEEVGQVEVPSLQLSPSLEAEAADSPSQTPTSEPTPDLEPGKQQLASSLFVGLASHSSASLVGFQIYFGSNNEVKASQLPGHGLIHHSWFLFLQQMGKTEETPHRFRRKAKASETSREGTSKSTLASSCSVDNFLCENLLDPESAVSSPSQASRLPLSLGTTNGTCDVEFADNNVEGEKAAPAADDVANEGTELAPREQQQTPTDFCLGSHVPAELRGLSRSDITPVSSNQSLHLSACHVQKEDALVLLLFFCNCSSSDFQHVRLELHSEELEVQ